MAESILRKKSKQFAIEIISVKINMTGNGDRQ